MKNTFSLISGRIGQFALVVCMLFGADVALGAAKALIDLQGSTPKPSLAKSWKKLKDGEYQFDLDTTQDVKPGTKVTPAIVKADIEAKLGSDGVAVTPSGASAVKITYRGAEADFLKKIAATRIRGTKVELALESSVSEGSIRARTLDRPAAEGEVKGLVVASKNDMLTVKVRESKFADVKVNDRLKVKTDGSKHKVKDFVYFVPEKKEGDVWVPKAGTVK